MVAYIYLIVEFLNLSHLYFETKVWSLNLDLMRCSVLVCAASLSSGLDKSICVANWYPNLAGETIWDAISEIVSPASSANNAIPLTKNFMRNVMLTSALVL